MPQPKIDIDQTIALPISGESLRPLIANVVHEVLAATEQAGQQIPADRLSYTEAEAAALLGLAHHVLRDERLRGRIRASRGPGKRVLYRREDLIAYLRERRIGS